MWRNNASLAFLIVVPTLFMIGLFYVLKISFANPVEMANDYQMTYKQVDKNYDQIVKQAKMFDEKYETNVTTPQNLSLKANRATIKISDKSGKPTVEANVTALLTRPDSTKLDKKLTSFVFSDGKYVCEPFDLEKEGRWQINFRVQVGDAVKFVNYEGFAKK